MMLLVLNQELKSLQWDIQNKDFDHAEWHIKDLLSRVASELHTTLQDSAETETSTHLPPSPETRS